MFDKQKNKNISTDINDLIKEDYKQQYFDECKYIWKNYVPKNGQASCLQGELLREIEKIRCEAMDNGNINWDEEYSYFCDFIKEQLCLNEYLMREEKERVSVITDYLKECGEYAQSFNNGDISDKDVDINKIAYVDDNLYDIIADAIGKLHKKHQREIEYQKNDNIHR